MFYSKSLNRRIRVRKSLVILCFLLVIMAATVTGDVGQSRPGTDSSVSAEPVSSAGEILVDRTIQSITFKKDMRIQDALRFLAERYQKNIVPSPNVDGLLAFTSLFDVTFEEALEAILGPNFKYEREGRLIKVYTKDEYKKIKEDEGRKINKVFTLYYISAAEAAKLVAPVLSNVGELQASSPAEKTVPTGESISAGASGGDSMALNDRIVIRDYPENVAEAEALLRELDVRPLQVLIEATILSATLTEELSLGIDWNTLNGIAISNIANIGAGIADGLSTTMFASTVKTSKSTGGLSVGVTNDHVAVLIRALESITDVTILANPKILAANKQLGQVYIGTKIGYMSQVTQTQTSTTSQVEFLDTGTKLSFRPYIGNDGYIRMDIHPKDSSGQLVGEIPEETSTEVATNIMVKDGETIVIGGLFRDRVTTTRSQVPLLGDLPVVGAAFRGTADVAVRQEVIVMLTTHIIEEPEETDGYARAADIGRKRYGARMTLQCIGRTKISEDHYVNAVRYYDDGNKVAALRELNDALYLRPTYFEALRLKDRIIGEVSPDEVAQIERIMLSVMDEEQSPMWRRW